MKIKCLVLLVVLLLISIVAISQEAGTIVLNRDLELLPLTENTYLHISYTESANYGRFPSNGIIYTDNDSVVIIDTPVNDSLSAILLSWLNEKGYYVKAVVPTHWHSDNLGGLKAFHDAGIRSYALSLTCKLAAQNGYEVPRVSFADSVCLSLGNTSLHCVFPGAGHTLDNIVVWIPSEKILFGGCLVKSLGSAGLGYIADADVEAWPDTIIEVMKRFPEAEIVVPGHGTPGSTLLLEHTYQLFRPK